MQIILLNDVDKVGDKHQVVSVKPGFGRNFLIPQGLAIVASEGNMRRLNELKRQDEIRENKKLNVYKDLAAQLEGVTLKIGAKTGTSGKIFGSVTNVQIAQALKDQCNLDVERKKIHILEEVKELGTYHAQIDFHKQVVSKVAFEVISE
ncbi:MAG: 50S ribosomal protein L9 [Saprospiraceae bacterium]|nr:50S ribosomal protein L9 [Candidatus Vicinibacter affinis]MBP6173082.1 50S ribosomal protein L9 [Saprospiraceae bacterium]MBK6573276.1 50S ribosomal protein L9 [Candidatus Vicinibacter affinis]MBK6822251.1 50S ribosomal protein L9 [Candidatus Vicinibacter affinis]MBK7301959.1 50S ribosomal protein L9 [Candidatus Vicinibacter affinis]